MFSRNIHEVSVFPEFKRVVVGVDFGFVNPSVCLVCGIDNDDRIYVIEEFYRPGVLIDELVKVCKQLKEKYGVQIFYADPAEPAYIQQLRNNGLSVEEALNDVQAGISLVASRLAIQKDGRPRLLVSERCVNTLMEFENYRYPETKDEKPVQENPIKLYDHSMDSLRYVVASLEQGGGIMYLNPEGLL